MAAQAGGTYFVTPTIRTVSAARDACRQASATASRTRARLPRQRSRSCGSGVAGSNGGKA
jgi:hypothetical protein